MTDQHADAAAYLETEIQALKDKVTRLTALVNAQTPLQGTIHPDHQLGKPPGFKK